MSNRHTRDERGSVSLWMVLVTFALVLIVGIAVDLGGQVHAKQRAHDVAAEAARAGAQQLTVGNAMRGDKVSVDPAKAKSAALAYVAAAGYTGSATLTSGDTLQVSVTGSYSPLFLGAAGVGPVTVTGSANARLARVLNGTER